MTVLHVARGVSWLPGNPPSQEMWAGLEACNRVAARNVRAVSI